MDAGAWWATSTGRKESDTTERLHFTSLHFWASQVVLVVKNPPVNAEHVRVMGSIPGSGKSPGVSSGNLLHYSCLGSSRIEEPGRLQSMGLVAKSRTLLSERAQI